GGRYLSAVMRVPGLDPGIDPRIHLFARDRVLIKRMDCRVKLGNDRNRCNPSYACAARIACIVCAVLAGRGGGIAWIACTERPPPRGSAAGRRARITKRPRTSVCTGSPFTRRPFHGVILEREASAASAIVH